MSKRAKEAALKAYPEKIIEHVEEPGFVVKRDLNRFDRNVYIQGYEQAEKDLELTWKDIKNIHFAIECVLTHTAWDDIYYPTDDSLYTEVLKRYNELKN